MRRPDGKRISISVSKLREEMPMILNRIRLLKESYVVTYHGNPIAILEPSAGTQTIITKSP